MDKLICVVVMLALFVGAGCSEEKSNYAADRVDMGDLSDVEDLSGMDLDDAPDLPDADEEPDLSDLPDVDLDDGPDPGDVSDLEDEPDLPDVDDVPDFPDADLEDEPDLPDVDEEPDLADLEDIDEESDFPDADLEDEPDLVLGSGLDERPSNPNCVAPDRPAPVVPVRLERVFPGVFFDLPIAAVQAPGDNSRWFVLEQEGRIETFPNDPEVEDTTNYANLTDRVACCREKGLLGMAFHPNYAENREVFLSYTYEDDMLGLVSRVSRFVQFEDRLELDTGSEEILLEVEQPYPNHNGGHISFGGDGFLYIALGDGGSAGDPLGHGQNTETLLGSMLRIDVDRGDPYGIPDDNPFVLEGGRPEIYAWGLRNPWKFSFDSLTQDLWAGDVGQNRWEEVDIVVRGGNYGWKVKEASECYLNHPLCDDESQNFIDPVVEYAHEGQASITGGYVYRGSSLPSLQGAYLYADYVFGRIWAVQYDPDTETYENNTLISSTGYAISSFAQDQEGEVYVMRYQANGGRLYKLVFDAFEPSDRFPVTLRETGCVNPDNPMEMDPGVLPYEINRPFWSDGADKTRWMAIPDGTLASLDEEGRVVFPPGSVLIKHFDLEDRRIETRLMVRHEDGGWAGYTYAWNEAQDDAVLLDAGESRTWGEQTWRYPSRLACLSCHNEAAGYALGTEVLQMNRNAYYPSTGRTAAQLETLSGIGWLQELPEEELPSLPEANDEEASIVAQARSYLHANCAYCHRPDGPGRGSFELRYLASQEDFSVCNTEPEEGDLGIEGARVVVPGDPSRSILVQRLLTMDDNRMPSRLGLVNDVEGIALLEAWIQGLDACDEPQP